jgi:integrase
MYYHDIKEYESIQEWFAESSLSVNTKRNALIAMRRYSDLIGMSPDELLEEAEREEEEVMKFKNRKLKKHLIRFKNFLEGKNELGERDHTLKEYAPTTAKLYITNVVLFYRSHEVTVKSLKYEKKAKPRAENNKRIQDKGMISMVLKRASPKQRAIILTIISSGLASEDVRHIPLQKYIEGYDPATEVCTLRLRRHKTEVDFVTFLNPEATRAINDYIEIRKKSYDPKQQIRNNVGYLFIIDQVKEIYIDHDYDRKHLECMNLLKSGFAKDEIPIELQKYLVSREEHRKYSAVSFLKIFSHLNDRCGITTPKGEFNVFRAHNLRKLFNQIMENLNVNHILVETWMGHEIDASNSAYSQYSPEQLKTYTSVMHHLYIDKQLDVAGSEEYQNLEVEVQRLKKENEINVVERYELSELKRELDEIKKREALKEEAMSKFPDEVLRYIQQEALKMMNAEKQKEKS